MTADFHNLGLIVVEDNAFQRKVAINFLGQLGVTQIIEAGDGVDALMKIRSGEWPVDVAVCDLDMPGMDGVQFIRHLGEERLVSSVILLSGMDSQVISSVETMAHAHGLAVLGTIEKPVSAQKLHNLLVRFEPGRVTHKPLPPSVSADDVLRGIDNKEFVAYYQPKVDFNTLEVRGVEALLRWRHPDKGLLTPAAFIGVAEQSGTIDALTTYVIHLAMDQIKEWSDASFETGVAVNLSLSYLGRTGVADEVTGLAQRLGIDAKRCTLEVTESLVTSNLANVLENLARLRMRGFEISIDDYGTGFSSMQQLSRIPFTELKIDQSFVTGASNRQNLRSILESSLQLAAKLKLQSVAEGIEKDEEWSLLKSLGCNIAQGYFIARPMPAEAVPEWHQSWTAGR